MTSIMNPLVSIIIPTFNYGRYLKECIDSALNQTYDNIEIIIVNDGSTDNTLSILKEYQCKEYQNSIRVISHSKNRGLSAARNTGISIMNGEYAKFSDADDIMYQYSVEYLVNASKQINDKKCIVFGNLDLMNESGEIIKKFEYDDCNNMSTREKNSKLFCGVYIAPTSSLLHKSLFEYGTFDENILLNEDYDLWLRLCLVHGCTIHLLSKPIIKVRKHHKSMTKVNHYKAHKQNVAIRKNILKQLEPAQRNYYVQELKKLKKSMPIRQRFRQTYQYLMYRILGGQYTERILDKYSKLRYNRPSVFMDWELLSPIDTDRDNKLSSPPPS